MFCLTVILTDDRLVKFGSAQGNSCTLYKAIAPPPLQPPRPTNLAEATPEQLLWVKHPFVQGDLWLHNKDVYFWAGRQWEKWRPTQVIKDMQRHLVLPNFAIFQQEDGGFLWKSVQSSRSEKYRAKKKSQKHNDHIHVILALSSNNTSQLNVSGIDVT
jgi:protease II